jgi:hypothetical protein
LLVTDEWEKTLRRPPRLEYFKNNEAMGLKDQILRGDKGRLILETDSARCHDLSPFLEPMGFWLEPLDCGLL